MIAQDRVSQRQCLDANYIDSIDDPFFKSVARRVVSAGTGDVLQSNSAEIDKAASANKRVEELEISIRRKLLELLLLQESGKSADATAVANVIGVFWKSSLDLCHHLVHHALSSSPPKTGSRCYEHLMPCRRLPYLLLSDCLEGLPSLEDAKCFWNDYVEPELTKSVLFGDEFWSQLTESNNSKKLTLPSSHLPFLKVANQFLKRLEHASDNGVRVEWKGRIMWALSKGFSIADKSSLKSWGNFHATNGTNFESKEDFNQHATIGADASKNTIEYNLYEAFWSLQNDFSNPNKIIVGDFIKRLRLVLAAMESATAASSNIIFLGQGDENGCIDKQATKYLTSSALLPSQIQDPVFRSSVVTQFLIVASHLGAESPPLKNALASLLGRARKLLKNDTPQLHDILWESILVNGREDHWRKWKKQKCTAGAFAPNFKRSQQLFLENAAADDDGHDEPESQQKRRRLAEEDEHEIMKGAIVSSLSRNVLENNDLTAVPKDIHKKLPTLDEHLEPYVEALDPESGIEDEYHPKNDSLFTWRAMRLYAKHQLPLMSKCRQPKDLEKITREWYRQSHGTDIPGGTPAFENSDINDENEQKADAGSAEEHAGDDRNDIDKNDGTNMDVEMKDTAMNEGVKGQGSHEKNDEGVLHSDESKEDQVNDQSKAKKIDKIKRESGKKETADAKKETKESLNSTESSLNGKATKSKTDGDDELAKTKNSDFSKSNARNEDQSSDKGRSNKNDNQRQEKRPPRENVPPQNRGGGRRGNEGGRNNNQERGRRDDGPPSRRRSDESHQPRGGGRPGGDKSYRGRSDGPPSRGGRYDEDYRGDSSRHHGDTRGERFTGDRSNRSNGRDNYRGGDRGGGLGRDDNRGGERSGDRMRRNTDNRSRGGGGGRR